MLDLGRFPYINADTTKIEVDGVVYVLDGNTVLRNELGEIEYDGASAINTASILVEDETKVFDIEVKDTNIITSFKYQRTEAQIAAALEADAEAAVSALETAVLAFDTTQAKLDAAKALVKPAEDAVAALADDVAPATTKADFEARIVAEKGKITAEETAVAEADAEADAEAAVSALETAVLAFDTTQAKLDAAKALVKPAEDAVAALADDVAPATTKADFEARIVAEKGKITAEETAVAKLAAAVKSVNDATTTLQMRTALEAADLGLDPTGATYSAKYVGNENAIADEMLVKGNFADFAAIKTAFEAVLALLP